MAEPLETRTKRGVFWSGLTTAGGQLVTFILGILLARLLSPEDFGVLALLIVFLEIGSTVISSGIVAALIQCSAVEEEHYDSAWLVMMALGGVVYAGVYGIAPGVGAFFHNALAGEVLRVLGLYFLMLPFVAIPTAKLRRAIDFRTPGIGALLQQLGGGLVAVTGAFAGMGVWSLVAGRLSGHLINLGYLLVKTRWWPSIRFHGLAIRNLLGYASKMVGVNLCNDLATNVDYLLVGRLLGAMQLGFYHRAYYLMTLPLKKVTNAVNLVLFSAFSEAQTRLDVLRHGFLKATAYATWICAPMAGGLMVIAPQAIEVVYGEKWLPAARPLQIMALGGLALALEPIAVSVVTAVGYVGAELKRQVLGLIVLAGGVLIGSAWGLPGVAVAVTAGAFLLWMLLIALVSRLIRLSPSEYLAVIAPPLFACSAMAGTVLLVKWALLHHSAIAPVGVLAILLMTGVATYGVAFWCLGYAKLHRAAREVHEEILRYSMQWCHRLALQRYR